MGWVIITRATPLVKIIAYAEGVMERTFLNLNFKYVDVVTMQNGRDWTVDAMCNQLKSKHRIKNGNADLFVVWIDREKQEYDPFEYESRLRNTLMDEGVDEAKIAIFMPNRMTENMILADEVLIRSQFSNPAYQYDFEGRNGKHALKMLFERDGVSYKETYHGVDMLKKCRVGRAAVASESVNRFHALLPDDCWWASA